MISKKKKATKYDQDSHGARPIEKVLHPEAITLVVVEHLAIGMHHLLIDTERRVRHSTKTTHNLLRNTTKTMYSRAFGIPASVTEVQKGRFGFPLLSECLPQPHTVPRGQPLLSGLRDS